MNNMYSGVGKYHWSIGDEYIGSYANHKRNGNGQLKLACGDTYTGDFKDDLYHGFGVYVFQSGEYGSYRGFYEGGQRHGYGEFSYTSGMTIVYSLTHSLTHSLICSLLQGDRFIGHIKRDFYDGSGKYVYKNGITYEGGFSNSRFNGRGTMTYPQSGEVFEGSFVDWKKSGPGKVTKKNGEVVHGIWHDDHKIQ